MPLFNRNPKIDELINSTLNSMSSKDPESEGYQDRLSVVERLTELKASGRKSLSWDTIVWCLGNLLGILIIVMYEDRNVITTKAFGFIGKKM